MKPTPMLVTADVVLFGENTFNGLSVLLIQRKNPPHQFCWALPGGFVDIGEDLLAAAQRELEEETNLKIDNLKQVGAFGNPKRDARGRVVTIAFTAKVCVEDFEPKAMDDAMNIGWFLLEELPPLAFDHDEIIKEALSIYS
jgi:8-oxo-dGTP diphosphatase